MIWNGYRAKIERTMKGNALLGTLMDGVTDHDFPSRAPNHINDENFCKTLAVYASLIRTRAVN